MNQTSLSRDWCGKTPNTELVDTCFNLNIVIYWIWTLSCIGNIVIIFVYDDIFLLSEGQTMSESAWGVSIKIHHIYSDVSVARWVKLVNLKQMLAPFDDHMGLRGFVSNEGRIQAARHIFRWLLSSAISGAVNVVLIYGSSCDAQNKLRPFLF